MRSPKSGKLGSTLARKRDRINYFDPLHASSWPWNRVRLKIELRRLVDLNKYRQTYYACEGSRHGWTNLWPRQQWPQTKTTWRYCSFSSGLLWTAPSFLHLGQLTSGRRERYPLFYAVCAELVCWTVVVLQQSNPFPKPFLAHPSIATIFLG